MVKDYVPVRSSVTTGVLIKQHILERNKYPVPQVNTHTTTSFYGSGSTPNISWNTPFVFQNIEITGSPIQMYEITGSTGGTMPDLFGLTSSQFTGNGIVNITQSWTGSTPSLLGPVSFTDSTQIEFFNGELSGSTLQVEDGELNPLNPYKLADTTFITYDFYQYTLNEDDFSNRTFENAFLALTPNTGEIFVYNFFDSPSNSGLLPRPTYGNKWIIVNKTSSNSIYLENTLGNLEEINIAGATIMGSQKFIILSIQERANDFVYLVAPNNIGFSLATGFSGTQGESAGSRQIVLSPFDSTLFFNSEFNSIINNAVIARPNDEFFDVDFSSNTLTAINSSVIINASRGSGSATPSTTPASNYTIARSANPRYNGSRTTSPTGSRYQSFVNQPMSLGSSIGNVANVENYCNWFAYFDNISPSFLAYELYIGGSQSSSITLASAVHVTTLIDVNGNTINLNPTNNIIPSSSLFGILDNKVNPLTSNIPLLNSIFPSNIYSGYLGTPSGTGSQDTPVSIRQYSFSGSSNVSSGSFQTYQVFSSGAQPDEQTIGPYTFQNIYGKPNETIVLLSSGSFITPQGNINGLLIPGNFNPEYSENILSIAQSAGFFKNI
jgi:hypothetical protein